MAIVQISQITNRIGLNQDLPQLAGAEFGWSTDTRQLYIGNGTLEQGAPVIGNTEILTEFSDIIALPNTYTYKGQAAGYTVQTGATPGTPVVQSLQSWLDQFATVTDFGAVGDGVTDDTAAINRALYQLYCRETNTQIRRGLFFPAGIYLVSGTIDIPPYAMLYGEGINSSIISLAENNGSISYVAQTADSLQQTGVNIGANGATPPQSITIENMGFQTVDPESSVFLLASATDCRFQNVGFNGPLTQADLQSAGNGTVCVDFLGTPTVVPEQIVFDGCVFDGTTYAVNTTNPMQGITFTNGQFTNFYKGILLGLGTPTPPAITFNITGVRITSNLFDKIYEEGIHFGRISLNASGHNVFYDVGNQFTGASGTPASPIIDIEYDNNLSISDLFERITTYTSVYPCVALNNTASISTTNGNQLALGRLVNESGVQSSLGANESGTVFSIEIAQVAAFTVRYTMVRQIGSSNYIRTGTISVVTAPVSAPANLLWSDNFIQNGDLGVSISFSQSGSVVSLNYTSQSPVNGFSAGNPQMTYSVSYLYTTL